MLLKDFSYLDFQNYLKKHQIIHFSENVLDTEVPGEGNMNFVIRIKLQDTSLIMKQALPYVHKYPQVAAPESRYQMENQFYTLLSQHKHLRSMGPSVLFMDTDHHILVLEDLGDMTDFTYLYNDSEKLKESEILFLTQYLNTLHADYVGFDEKEKLQNLEMRQLNAEHIFHYPFQQNNGLNLDDITPGLDQFAQEIRDNSKLLARIDQLKEIYLQDGDHLLHGDFYPGSWLKSLDKIKIIDPEFGFFGHKEFELGVMLAHMLLSNHQDSDIDLVKQQYTLALDLPLLNGFIGIEIMRRLIGLAQLPLDLSLEQKSKLLSRATSLILNE